MIFSMFSKYLRFLIVFSIVFLMTVASEVKAQEVIKKKKMEDVGIAPSSLHEECLDMKPDQELFFSFEVSQAAHFNIHYHQGKEVSYPVNEKNVTRREGTFRPEIAQHYCLMWSNPEKHPISLSYRIRLMSADSP